MLILRFVVLCGGCFASKQERLITAESEINTIESHGGLGNGLRLVRRR
jgi:hypothetical protein